jgi:hypothetical protein
MSNILMRLASIGFVLWGLYRGFWVLRKVWIWARTRYQAFKAERTFVNMLADQIRYDEKGGEFLRSTPPR